MRIRTSVVRKPVFLLLCLALVTAVLLFHQRFQLVLVVGESMQPTLKPGQLLLVDKRAYQHAQPRRGDIVLARYAGELIIKRIVALPGEEVEVRRGTLYIDGVTKREGYPIQEGSLDVAKGKLFNGDFATLGDNRAIPSVLAIHPVISKPDIVGRLVHRELTQF